MTKYSDELEKELIKKGKEIEKEISKWEHGDCECPNDYHKKQRAKKKIATMNFNKKFN